MAHHQLPQEVERLNRLHPVRCLQPRHSLCQRCCCVIYWLQASRHRQGAMSVTTAIHACACSCTVLASQTETCWVPGSHHTTHNGCALAAPNPTFCQTRGMPLQPSPPRIHPPAGLLPLRIRHQQPRVQARQAACHTAPPCQVSASAASRGAATVTPPGRQAQGRLFSTLRHGPFKGPRQVTSTHRGTNVMRLAA